MSERTGFVSENPDLDADVFRKYPVLSDALIGGLLAGRSLFWETPRSDITLQGPIVVLVNPVAGGGKGLKNGQKTRDALTRPGVRVRGGVTLVKTLGTRKEQCQKRSMTCEAHNALPKSSVAAAAVPIIYLLYMASRDLPKYRTF